MNPKNQGGIRSFLFRGALGVFLVLATFSRARAEELLLSGSSMLLPLNRAWAVAFEKNHPGTVVRVSGPGSGVGISSAASGNATIGASDLFLPGKELRKNGNVVLVPVALEGTVVIVNMPLSGMKVLHLTGRVLARLFSGKIGFWDDPSIEKLNPGLPLPHLAVRSFHRSDSSGTSFVLTDYLARTSRLWRDSVGRESLPDWPVWPGSSGVSGSAAMVRSVRSLPGAIGYVGLGWAAASGFSGGIVVALENQAGHFIPESVRSVRAAGRAAFSREGLPSWPDDFNRSIVWDLPGSQAPKAYPAASVEFWMVSPDLPGKTMEKVRDLIEWVLTTGQSPEYTVRNGFVPLPDLPGKPRLNQLLRRLLPGNTYRPVSPG